ncbi:hypothetical protein DID73_00295 [Candidatus Marinamargulisbacteria bacterium SCGC AG-343-K17]|nr:hypothetical protein DID73_00295 [Candidatus Marinamargulisbacteria bacterium SCGC AG-343-K17]
MMRFEGGLVNQKINALYPKKSSLKRSSARTKKHVAPQILSRKIPFPLVPKNKGHAVSTKLSSDFNQMRRLLKLLQSESLIQPLYRVGVYSIEDLQDITPTILEKKYQLKLTKLLAFVQSGWLNDYKTNESSPQVVFNFQRKVSGQFKQALMYVQHGCDLPTLDLDRRDDAVPVTGCEGRGAVRSVKLPRLPKKVCYGRKWFMSFGIDDYLHWPSLHNAVSDSTELTSYFTQQHGFQSFGEPLNGPVTKDSMARFFQKTAPMMCGPDDVLVVSFHGHGHTMSFQGKDYGFLVPSDAPQNPSPYDLISMDHLASWLKYIPSRHVLLLLDSCFSGLMAQRGLSKAVVSTSRDLSKQSYLRYHLSKVSRIVINAGHGSQMVSDGGWGTHSIFTGAILSSDVLRNDSSASIYTFFNAIHDTVVSSGHSQQIPTMARLPGDSGSDLFLGLSS